MNRSSLTTGPTSRSGGATNERARSGRRPTPAGTAELRSEASITPGVVSSDARPASAKRLAAPALPIPKMMRMSGNPSLFPSALVVRVAGGPAARLTSSLGTIERERLPLFPLVSESTVTSRLCQRSTSLWTPSMDRGAARKSGVSQGLLEYVEARPSESRPDGAAPRLAGLGACSQNRCA
jgi:hypothetical protein